MLKLTLDLQTYPKLGDPAVRWRHGDYEFLSNRKALAKLHNNFSRIPHNLHCRIIVTNNDRSYKEAPTVVLPDYINFTMTNNITTDNNWIPPTSWILCHRIAHAMLYERQSPANLTLHYDVENNPEAALWIGLLDIWNLLCGSRPAALNRSTGFRRFIKATPNFSALNLGVIKISDWAPMLCSELFTMRSARDRIMANELDVFAEAWAQFMVIGQFKMNRIYEEDLIRMKTVVWEQNRHVTSWGAGIGKEICKNIIPVTFTDRLPQINSRIEELETEVNQKMVALSRNLVGKHVQF